METCILCKKNEGSNNPFPLAKEGNCCFTCDILVIYCRKLCQKKGFYYITDKEKCYNYIQSIKHLLPIRLTSVPA